MATAPAGLLVTSTPRDVLRAAPRSADWSTSQLHALFERIDWA